MKPLTYNIDLPKQTAYHLSVFALLFFTCFMLLPGAAVAADPTYEGPHSNFLEQLFWPCLNFAVYVWLLVWAAKKHIAPTIQAHSAHVAHDMELAAEEQQKALSERDGLKQQLARIDLEKEQIVRQLSLAGEQAAQAIVEQVKAQAGRLARDVERQVSTETSRAGKDVRDSVVMQATEIARAKLLQTLSPELDHKLRMQAIEAAFTVVDK